MKPQEKDCHCGSAMGKGICLEQGSIQCKELVYSEPPSIEEAYEQLANAHQLLKEAEYIMSCRDGTFEWQEKIEVMQKRLRKYLLTLPS
jgi:hypothetical protein